MCLLFFGPFYKRGRTNNLSCTDRCRCCSECQNDEDTQNKHETDDDDDDDDF